MEKRQVEAAGVSDILNTSKAILDTAKGAPGVIKNLPFGQQLGPNANNPMDLKGEERTQELQILSFNEARAIGNLTNIGLTVEQAKAAIDQIKQFGLGEPTNEFFGYVEDIARMGFLTFAPPGTILTIANALWNKAFANRERAMQLAKPILDYAAKHPGKDILDTMAKRILGGGQAEMDMLAAGIITTSPEDLPALGEALGTMEFMTNPESEMTKRLWGPAQATKKRRTWQAGLNIKFNELWTNITMKANESASKIFENYYKNFSNMPQSKKAVVDTFSFLYKGALVLDSLKNMSGLYGESYLKPRSQSEIVRISLASNDDVNMIRVSAGDVGAAPVAPVTVTPVTDTPVSTTASGLATWANNTGNKDIKSSSMEYLKIADNLNSLIQSAGKIAATIANQMKAEETGYKDFGPNVTESGIEGMGSLSPESIETAGAELIGMTSNAKKWYSDAVKCLDKIQTLTNSAYSTSTSETQKQDWIVQKVVLNADLRAKYTSILTLEMQGIFIQYYGPTQRKINLIQPALSAIKVQIDAINESDSPEYKAIRGTSLFPLYHQQINLYRQWIIYLFQGFSKLQTINVGNDNIGVWLNNFKNGIAVRITDLQAQIKAITGKMFLYGFGSGQGIGSMLSGHTASVCMDKMVREASKEIQDALETREADKEVEADARTKQYWGKLLPGGKGKPDYGDVLENPQKFRKTKINYKPKFHKTTKFIKYRQQ